MARHRDIRNLSYDDYYEDEDEVGIVVLYTYLLSICSCFKIIVYHVV